MKQRSNARRRSASAKARARLRHPIIDTDGHYLELTPIYLDYIREVGGSAMVARYRGPTSVNLVYRSEALMSPPEHRRDNQTPISPWWGWPAKNTLDRATAMIPGVLASRMDDLGLDFTVLYPSEGLFVPTLEDDDLRRVACRAFNRYVSDLYAEFSDRMTPAAVIPVHTPQEAIEELEYAVRELGLKAAMFGGGSGVVFRPIPRIQREGQKLDPVVARLATWPDMLALDSAYDYDPLWAKCVELKVAVTFHAGQWGWGTRRSISNSMYNHIGCLSATGEALCKAIFLGGVTKRFPTLNFAFLEGGSWWGCALYSDIIAHWLKRNGEAIESLNPANLDKGQLLGLAKEYGDSRIRSRREDIRQLLDRSQPHPAELDEFAACGIRKAEDIKERFVERFYFGCEADDPKNAWAFDTRVNPFGARVRAILGSDIGHWDVVNMDEVVEEACEMVEGGLLAEQDLKEMTFVNPVRLHGGMNPDFFQGTRVEAQAAKELANHPKPAMSRPRAR